jgi:hypothetical protein
MHPSPNGTQQLSAEQIREHLALAAEWIAAAQDTRSDGGVSAGFDFYSGWQSSYPEIIHYIIPTALTYAKLMNRPQ